MVNTAGCHQGLQQPNASVVWCHVLHGGGVLVKGGKASCFIASWLMLELYGARRESTTSLLCVEKDSFLNCSHFGLIVNFTSDLWSPSGSV